MKRIITLLLTLTLAVGFGMAATKKLRQRLTFDQGWQFRLCVNYDEVRLVLDSLGVKEAPSSSPNDAPSDSPKGERRDGRRY